MPRRSSRRQPNAVPLPPPGPPLPKLPPVNVPMPRPPVLQKTLPKVPKLPVPGINPVKRRGYL